MLALILLSLTLPQAAQAATFEVNTAADTDDGTCNAADCSLREAINDANNNPNGGAPDRIEFRIGASGSPAQIVLGSALPIITDPLVIDGFTQGGTSCINVDGTVLTVEVNGGPGGFNGFVIDTDDTTINGLVINGFTGTGVAGVRIQGDNNSLTCSFFGTNTTGTAAVANGSGVIIDGGANNQIGTNGQANLISGNTDYGVHLTGAAATNNLVQFNTIGLNRTGTAALANGNSGVFIDGAPNNGILNNLITSNPTGIFISGVGAASNRLFGNIIGLDVTGSTVIAGGTTGISVNNAPDNRIGGTNPSEINTVSGQAADGILITGAGATGNRVENNYVGTDISALNDLGNGDNGIEVLSASGNTIGGNVPEAGNLVGGNQQFGILLDATANNNTVANNRIGINVNFNGTIPNNVGIVVRFSSNNLIGGPNQGNTVGGNLGSGITLTEASSTGNTVQGNYVGLTSFNDVFGNGSYGIRVNTAANNLIGGTGVGEGNTVANNTRDGVIIAGAAAGNRILGNLISNNGGLGIDLDTDDTDAGNADVTANDPGDADGGANAQQNFPVITAARGTNVDIYLAGTLDSTANTTYRLEFYSNPTCDASGNGESAVFIASTTVTTDGAGAATFAEIFPLGAPINTGDSITATATDQTTNNTSELSPCVVITDAPKYEADTPPGTVSVSTTVGFPTDITVRADNRDGRAPLDISSVTIDNTTDFTLITPITPPTVTIAAGDPVSNFANITVRCLAANLGTFQTTLTILTNDPTQPAGGFIYTLICQVNPVNPTPVYLSVPAAGQTIDFGGVLVNTPGTQQLRIENTGTADLTVNLAITSGGANFAIQPPTALTITASNFTLVNLTCTPTALGPITGTLQALTNDTNQPVGGFTYPLTCEGLVPGYASTPAPGATINLTTTVGTPVTTTVTVSETGNAPLDVSDVSLSNTTGFTRTTPASFTINNGGAAQDIIVQCDATSPGNFTTDLNVETNDPAQPGGGFSYTINCLVNAAGYNSTPLPGTAINLTTTVGTPTDATIAVQETGNLPLTVNVALSNTTDFTLTSPATFTINDGGAAQNIVVRCNATTDTGSPFTTTVTVTTNDPTQPVGGYTYTVNCTVTPVTGTPGYGSTPPSGTVIPLTTTVGTPIDATIAVNETGTAPLTVNVALSNTTDFTLTSPTTFNIADGGAAQNIVVRCNATTDTGSPFTTTVTVTTNDPSQPTVTYTVNCTVNRPVYRSAPTPGGTIPLTTTQGTPVNAIISVNEGGNAALIVDNVVLSNTTNFTLLSPTTFTINDGGAAQDIIVQCNATTSIGSPFTTNVTGTHNAAGSPAIYTVVCTVNPVTGTPGYGSTPPSGTAIPLTTTVGTPIDTTIAVNETGTAPLTVNVAL
ncbi:MAG: choice-of-anchor D domain-containing protein, partial [bacterium]|nr:choice-of-anchor D domain-containing protein [bacterium]